MDENFSLPPHPKEISNSDDKTTAELKKKVKWKEKQSKEVELGRQKQKKKDAEETRIETPALGLRRSL